MSFAIRTRKWSFAPLQFQEADFADRNDNYLEVTARLRPSGSLQQARAGMNVVADQLRRQYPRELEHAQAFNLIVRPVMSPQHCHISKSSGMSTSPGVTLIFWTSLSLRCEPVFRGRSRFYDSYLGDRKQKRNILWASLTQTFGRRYA